MTSLRPKLANLPSPVSPAAVELGCSCPGARGERAGERVRGEDWHWYDSECRLHGNAVYAAFGELTA